MTTMKAWRCSGVAGGLEKNLQLKDVPRPEATSLTKDQLIIETLAVSLNPADYKMREVPVIGNRIITSNASPGMDFSGRIQAVHASITILKAGDLIAGRLDPTQGPMTTGVLSEYIVAGLNNVTLLPSTLDADSGSCLGTAALTSYQSMHPFVKNGDKIFINGGSGGVGSIGIQMAKAMGLHVTTSCSDRNVQFCKELGADEVLDYKSSPLLDQLKSKGRVFDHVVDNVGNDLALYKSAQLFMKPTATYVQVGGGAKEILFMATAGMLPTFLGGGKQKYKLVMAKQDVAELKVVADMAGEGKFRPVIDEVFAFNDAVKAFEKLKTGRAKGKIVVHVKDA